MDFELFGGPLDGLLTSQLDRPLAQLEAGDELTINGKWIYEFDGDHFFYKGKREEE